MFGETELFLNSKTQRYRKLLQKTRERFLEVFGKYKNISVSFSTGKDSTVLINLAYEIAKPKILFVDSGAVFPENYELLEIYKNKGFDINIEKSKTYWELLEIENTKGLSPQKWMEEIVFSIARDFNKKHNIECQIIGLRKEESRKRKKLGQYKGDLFYAKNTESFNFYPLLDWRGVDIFTYIFENKSPYNSLYNKYNELTHKPLYEYRVDSYLEDAGIYESMQILKRWHPNIHKKVINLFPYMNI